MAALFEFLQQTALALSFQHLLSLRGHLPFGCRPPQRQRRR